MSDEARPATKRDAAFRILFSELSELFAKVESLLETVQTVDASAKQSARTLQETLRAAKQVAAALPDKPVPMVEPKKANPLTVSVCAAIVAGIVAGGVVAGCSMWIGGSREEARVGRAVMAAWPSLDTGTREKLQAAINAASR